MVSDREGGSALQQTLADAKRKFHSLTVQGASQQAIIELLLCLRTRTDLSVDDLGWVLWNLCDQYAMLRDASTQLTYQQEFYEWSQDHLWPHRLHWVVCDGTQAMTLSDGGFLNFWWECYQFANEHCPRWAENRNVRFESHRATSSVCVYFSELERAKSALDALEELIAEDKEWANYNFAVATLKTLQIEYYNAIGEYERVLETSLSVESDLDKWLRWVRQSGERCQASELLLGTWEQLNANRPPKAVFVATHNAACALARVKHFRAAERAFRMLVSEGYTITAYGQALYVLSCWENRHDRSEVRELLRECKGITPKTLEKFTPQLIDVLGDGSSNLT